MGERESERESDKWMEAGEIGRFSQSEKVISPLFCSAPPHPPASFQPRKPTLGVLSPFPFHFRELSKDGSGKKHQTGVGIKHYPNKLVVSAWRITPLQGVYKGVLIDFFCSPYTKNVYL